jgi:hypothetical protein
MKAAWSGFRTAEPIRQVGCEGLDSWAVDELAGPDHIEDGRVDFVLDAGVLPAYVHHVQLHAPQGVGNGGEDNPCPLAGTATNRALSLYKTSTNKM